MAVNAGQGFIDILPRINPATFAASMQAQTAPAFSKFTSGLKTAATATGVAIGAPLAIAAVGGVAGALGKLTLDFEDAFTRIDAISNASAEQIAGWREEVIALSRETAIAPNKLAEGLFFLASAGLRAEEIFPALRASAQAAAVGLGEMGDLARITAQVLNAYPAAGLKAKDAIDVLVAAVREGSAEPDEFADAMGRLLPIASKADVSFDELAASLATLSNIGLDVDEGVTGVRQVLNAIVAPGKQAADTMNEIGFSTEELRKSLAEDGLIATLNALDKASNGNIDTLRKIIPNIRAMTAAFGLTEQEMEKVDKIFQRVKDSGGDLGEALDATRRGPGFKFRQLMVELQNFALKLGQTLLPVASSIAEAFITILGPLTSLLDLMSKIPGLATAITIALAGFAAVKFLPPLLLAISKGFAAMNLAAAASKALDLGIALGSLGRIALTTAAPLSLIPSAVFALAKVSEERGEKALKTLEERVRRIGTTSEEAQPAVMELRRALVREEGGGFRTFRTEEELERIHTAVDKRIAQLETQHRLRMIQNTDLKELNRQIREMGRGFGPGVAFIADLTGKTLPEFTRGLRTALAQGQVKIGEWRDFVADTMGDAAKAFQDFHTEAAQNLDFVGGALSELSSQQNLTTSEILTAFEKARRKTKEFGADLLTISKTGGQAGKDLAAQLLSMGDAGVEAADTIAGANEDMRLRLIRSFGAGRAAAEDLATRLTKRIVGTLEDIRDILDAIARNWGITVTSNADKAKTDIDRVRESLLALDGTQANTSIIVRTTKVDVPGGDANAPKPIATGGVIPGRSGFVTRGPTYLVGEGRRQTFAGKGTEGVIPFDQRGIAILSEALGRALAGMNWQGGGGDVHVTVELDGEKVGRALARRSRRRGELVGATA